MGEIGLEKPPVLRLMMTIIEAINQKLDLALSRFQEIDNLKENLKDLQKENIDLKESLSFTHKEGGIKALQIGVNGLQKDVKMERECAIKLKSHS